MGANGTSTLLFSADTSIPSVDGELVGHHLIVDAFDRTALQELLQALPEPCVWPLSRQSVAKDVDSLLPTVIALQPLFRHDPHLLQTLCRCVQEEEAGIVAATDVSPDALVQHAKFILEIHADAEIHAFRYYDPIVLERYLAASQQSDLDAIFGSCQALGVMLPNAAWRLYRRQRTLGRTNWSPPRFEAYHEASFLDVSLAILAERIMATMRPEDLREPARTQDVISATLWRCYFLGFRDVDDLWTIATIAVTEAPWIPTCESFCTLAQAALALGAGVEAMLIEYLEGQANAGNPNQ